MDGLEQLQTLDANDLLIALDESEMKRVLAIAQKAWDDIKAVLDEHEIRKNREINRRIDSAWDSPQTLNETGMSVPRRPRS